MNSGVERDKGRMALRGWMRAAMGFLGWLAVPWGAAGAAPPLAGNALLSEGAFLNDMPVVLSVSRMEQPLSGAPTATTVIDREMIKASGFRDIPDLLRLVPGFYVAYSAGNFPFASYHGLSDDYARRMQVLVDGRSIYTPLFGGVEWSDLPLAMEDIDRIEVIRGPAAAVYGANSFLGAINIITRHPAQEQGFYASATKGNGGVADGLMRFGGTVGPMDYRLTVAQRADDGFDNRVDSQRIDLVTFRGDITLGLADTVEIQFGYNGGPRGLGQETSLLDRPRNKDINSQFQQVRWRHVVDAGNEFSLQFYHNYHHSNENEYTAPIPPYNLAFFIANPVRAERYDLEFQQNLSPIAKWRFVWGASARIDRVTAPLYFNTPDTLSNQQRRVFGNAEWHVSERWILNAGAMWENDGITGSDVSPRVAINYHVLPEHTLRASVSSANRTPVLIEESSDYSIRLGRLPPIQYLKSAGGLRPEHIVSREIGYIGQYAGGRVMVDLKLYRDRLTNLITPASNDFTNADWANVHGVEGQVKFRTGPEDQIIVGGAHTIVDSSNPDYAAAGPQNSYSILAMHRFPGSLSGSVGYYYVGGRQAPSFPALPAYRRLDLRLAHDFKVKSGRGTLALVIQNMLDEYAEFQPTNLFGTRAFVTFSLHI